MSLFKNDEYRSCETLGRYIQGKEESHVLYAFPGGKKEWFGCERIKTDASKQEQAHKLYGKEAYLHSSKQYDIHVYEMMNYIARKEGVKKLSRFMNEAKQESAKEESKQENYCEPSQNSRNVKLVYDTKKLYWKLPVEDDKGRNQALFHPLLNIKLVNKILKPQTEKGIGKLQHK